MFYAFLHRKMNYPMHFVDFSTATAWLQYREEAQARGDTRKDISNIISLELSTNLQDLTGQKKHRMKRTIHRTNIADI